MDDINKALKRMFVMMKQMRSDQMRALGTTKNALCLSCGRGEPNFPPPSDFVPLKSSSNRFKEATGIFTKEILLVRRKEQETSTTEKMYSQKKRL